MKRGQGASGAAPDRVIYLPGCDWGAGEVSISGDEFHHLARVLRAKPGERLHAIDGSGGAGVVEVTLVASREVRCAIVERLPAPAPPALRVRLAAPLIRPARMDWLVEKAVEIGAAEIAPVRFRRSLVGESEERSERRITRWERIAVAAVKQSRRARLPDLRPEVSLAEFLGARPLDERLFIAWEQGGAPSLAEALRARPLAIPGRAAFLAGPEGGLTPEEAEAGRAAGGEWVGLGPAILRAETACLVGLSILLHEGGLL